MAQCHISRQLERAQQRDGSLSDLRMRIDERAGDREIVWHRPLFVILLPVVDNLLLLMMIAVEGAATNPIECCLLPWPYIQRYNIQQSTD